MLKWKRSYVVMASMAVLLGVAGYLNWSYNQGKTPNEEAKILGEAAYVSNAVVVEENDLFSKDRLDRETARDAAKETLTELINNPNADQTQRLSAQQEVIRLAQATEQEKNCEILIKNKGFGEVLVTITADTANVSVDRESLIPAEIAQIQEIGAGVTKFTPDQIKISLAR